MRLIDADAVLEELKRMEVEMMPAKLAHIYTAVVIEDSPTIDAVPVVRCKDCKWKADTIGESWCDFHEFTILSDDDYCYHGERRRR